MTPTQSSNQQHNLQQGTSFAQTQPSHYATLRRIAALGVIFVVLLIDQSIKVWVKTHLALGESIRLTDWAYIFFTENKGMAFGLEFVGTMALCLFRIAAIVLLAWALWAVTKLRDVSLWFVILLSMILAGAAGNIIDNMFYGLIFSDTPAWEPAQLVPFGHGYGSLMEGHVVDMFYFPIIHTHWPEWMPVVGGREFTFFSPIFNFADAAITTGALLIIFCYHKTLNRLLSHDKSTSDTNKTAAPSEDTASQTKDRTIKD